LRPRGKKRGCDETNPRGHEALLLFPNQLNSFEAATPPRIVLRLKAVGGKEKKGRKRGGLVDFKNRRQDLQQRLLTDRVLHA